MNEQDFYAYVVISAHGRGNADAKDHATVIATVPEVTRAALAPSTEPFDEDDAEPTTQWSGPLTEEQWRALQDGWDIDPETSELTAGMLTDLGHMWALCYSFDGMDWNMGGITPVDYVDVYYCTQDASAVARVTTPLSPPPEGDR